MVGSLIGSRGSGRRLALILALSAVVSFLLFEAWTSEPAGFDAPPDSNDGRVSTTTIKRHSRASQLHAGRAGLRATSSAAAYGGGDRPPACKVISARKPTNVRVLVAVFPGAVEGFAPADRTKRLGAFTSTWASDKSIAYHGVAFDFVFVGDRAKPHRDDGFRDRRLLNVTQLEEQLFGESGISAADDNFAIYLALFSRYFAKPPPHDETPRTRYDWLFSIHDHATFIPPNLACYVRKLMDSASAADEPVAAGSVLQIKPDQPQTRFISDAAGMLINTPAIRLLIDMNCRAGSKWHREGPTHRIAECLIKKKVPLTPALEEPDGAELVNVYTPVRTVWGQIDDWFATYKSNAGLDPSKRKPAQRPVSFHYVDFAENIAIARTIITGAAAGNRACMGAVTTLNGGDPVTRAPTAEDVFSHYPSPGLIGGYSRPLQPGDKTVRYLLQVAEDAWAHTCPHADDGRSPAERLEASSD